MRYPLRSPGSGSRSSTHYTDDDNGAPVVLIRSINVGEAIKANRELYLPCAWLLFVINQLETTVSPTIPTAGLNLNEVTRKLILN